MAWGEVILRLENLQQALVGMQLTYKAVGTANQLEESSSFFSVLRRLVEGEPPMLSRRLCGESSFLRCVNWRSRLVVAPASQDDGAGMLSHFWKEISAPSAPVERRDDQHRSSLCMF